LPTFAELEAAALCQIAASAETRFFRAGEIIFRQDEPADSAYVVLSGSIALDSSKNGNAAVRIIEPPSIIGNMSMLATALRPATAIARESASVLKISRKLFHRVLTDYPQSAEYIRQSLAKRLRLFAAELQPLESFSSPRRQNLYPQSKGIVGSFLVNRLATSD
jgi:CRP-like cAMP-binding protein